MEILLFFMLLPDTQLNIGVKLALNNQHEQSEQILKNIRARDTKHPETYMFYRFLNNFRMNNKKESEKYADYLQGIEHELPERYQVLTYLMKDNLKQWKADDLEDIARDMSHVKDRLSEANAGRTTKQIQIDIIAKLDKMIKENEDKLKDKNQGSADSQGSSQNQSAKQPLEESGILNEGGKGTVNQAKLRKMTENWGSLPPRERTQILQELTNGMSARHREAIVNYFRNLAENQNKTRR